MPEVLELSDLGFRCKASEIRDLCYPVRSGHSEPGDLESINEKAVKHDFDIEEARRFAENENVVAKMLKVRALYVTRS